jgi:ATP/maltotriose-dependent transcriptional regulator MalT
MRVILVGMADMRSELRAECRAAGMTVVGEAASVEAANALEMDADALLVARRRLPLVRVRTDERPQDEPLTPRELEVVTLLTEGLPNKAIAERLGISDQTVKFHVASIYGKLGASNRTDAVRRALRLGIVTL